MGLTAGADGEPPSPSLREVPETPLARGRSAALLSPALGTRPALCDFCAHVAHVEVVEPEEPGHGGSPGCS